MNLQLIDSVHERFIDSTFTQEDVERLEGGFIQFNTMIIIARKRFILKTLKWCLFKNHKNYYHSWELTHSYI